MKKVLVIVVTIVVVGILVGAIVWMRDDGDGGSTSTSAPSTGQTSEDGDSSEQLTIRYDGSSFTPSTLTIRQGDTVTFVNGSSTLVWPASDDHPVHDDLSGFDALEGLAEGEEYSFTFNEAGEWGYHNHLASTEGGTIIVE